MSIPPELTNRLRTALLRCEVLESDRALRAVFADARIDSWRYGIPHADSPDERAKKVVDYLHRQTDEHGENVLVLLLRVLGEQMPPTDARHQELADLANELEREFKLHPPRPEAPENSARKFRRFLFGDTEAQRAYRNRQAMLKLVHNTWIKGVLEQSLHGAALIELGMEYDPTAVDHPWDIVVQMPERPDQRLPPGTRIVDVFDEVGGSLLILGEPGSGKTTMLLELVRDLIARAEEAPLQPIPVVFNLSSWAVKQQPLAGWLVEELRTKYYVPKKVAQAWIKDDSLLLLLDGLDEIKADARDKCVAAINAFRKEHLVFLAVCSRTADYEALTAKLHLQGAICLRSLTVTQIDTYLAGADVELRAVRITLKHDPILQEMAESPLFLSIMTLAYHGKSIDDLQTMATPETRRQHLFDTYIERMFQHRSKGQTYTREQTCHWLVWLAQQVTEHKQSAFYIENLQPNWLPDHQCQRVRYLARLAFGTIGGVSLGLVGGLVFGSLGRLAGGLDFGLILGLSGWLVFTLFFGLFFGLLGMLDTIKTVETLTWSWLEARGILLKRLASGLAIGVLGGVINNRLIFGSLLGLSVGLVVGLVDGLVSKNANFKTVPNQGIHQSLANALSLGLVVGVAMGFIFRLIGRAAFGQGGGLIFGLSVGLIFALSFGMFGELAGGRAVVLHYSLRAVLAYTNRAPWNYARFLDYCVDRIFLRRVGGGYIFVHRLLQEHFASLTPEDIERIAGDSRATV